ncbi:hypothetical protein F5X97DRAFT_303753 [Nemania serpens]|nr:hypothetical protein F5X97DRAFT_303753 [Nemania serpens]
MKGWRGIRECGTRTTVPTTLVFFFLLCVSSLKQTHEPTHEQRTGQRTRQISRWRYRYPLGRETRESISVRQRGRVHQHGYRITRTRQSRDNRQWTIKSADEKTVL